MLIITGLGNPGKKFENTRHNIGFMVIDKFKKENKFPDFKLSKKFNAEISKGILGNEEIILAKPQTFMNCSGKAVKKLISNFQFLISNLWVVHDDIDLPLGKIKIVKNRGPAGHNGVKSIIENLGTKDFFRFRVGINSKTWNMEYETKKIEFFVLQKFNKKEREILKEVIKKTVKAIEMALKENVEKAMNEFNL